MPKSRLLYLDFLRGFSILYIVGIHHLDDYAGEIYQNKTDDILTYALLGLFVFISGYLLSYNTPINDKKDLLIMIRKRFIRIYPLYVLALFLFMLCSIMSFKSVLSHMLFFNVILDRSVQTLWFVSVIFVFYFLYPLIVYKYSIIKTCIIFVILYFFSTFIKINTGFLDARLLIYFPLFVFGIVSQKHNLIENQLTKTTPLFCSISLFFLTTCLYFELNGIFKSLSLILFMLSAVPVLLILGKYFSRIVNVAIYEKIAYASYCMYLFHRIIFIFMINIYNPHNNFAKLVYLSVLGLPLIYMVSCYTQKYYDDLVISFKQA